MDVDGTLRVFLGVLMFDDVASGHVPTFLACGPDWSCGRCGTLLCSA